MTIKAATWMLFGFAVASVAVSQASAQGKTQWDGVFTEAQAKRGEAVYTQECATCHGAGLEGMGEAAPLAGAEFASFWNDLALHSLYERIRVAMPKEKPNSLTREQYADVVAFILSKNGAPAGQTELLSTNDALKAIMFKATK